MGEAAGGGRRMSKISMEINLRKLSLLERAIKEIDFKEESDREKVLSALHSFANEHSVLSQTLRVDPIVDAKGIVGFIDKIFPPASAKANASFGTHVKKQPKEEKKSIDERFADLDVEFDDGDFI